MKEVRIPAVAVAAAVAIAAGLTSPAAAQPEQRTINASQFSAKHRITLITGDRVAVDAKGRVTGIERAEGREHIPVRIRRVGGHTLVIPADAARLVATGKVDRRLFDVTELGKAGTRKAQKHGGRPRRIGPGDETPYRRALDDVTITTTVTTQQGVRLPAAARPARWAADMVAATREEARMHLDYSERSLLNVDLMIEGIRQEAAPYTAVMLVLRGFGAYAGEVMVRQVGGEWWALGDEYWVRTPDGRLWDPIEEAGRCYRGDGSLRLLCRKASSESSP